MLVVLLINPKNGDPLKTINFIMEALDPHQKIINDGTKEPL